jgi:hypothetical protein
MLASWSPDQESTGSLHAGGSIRWSNGIYCTRRDIEPPAGQRVLSFWHDNLRVASTYGAADPINWE